MQVRKRNMANDSGGPSEEVMVVRRRWELLPLLAVLLVASAYVVYAGRSQIFDAVGGARAYIVASFSNEDLSPRQSPDVIKQLGKPVTGAGALSVVRPTSLLQAKPQPMVFKEVKVITEITLANGTKMQILEEPMPPDCYPEAHADYDGLAVGWGLGNKARSAAECCRMCKEHKPDGAIPNRCNIWVWCGDPSGVCWTMDIHNHTTGDCWLKYQAGWDGQTDLQTTNLKVNHRYAFTPEFRQTHKTAPELIPWVAGLVPRSSAKSASSRRILA